METSTNVSPRQASQPRSALRFKFVNTAVRQTKFLGITKLVLITCAEFANDAGIFWHDVRTLGKCTGLGRTRIAEALKELETGRVVVVLRRGHSHQSGKYQLQLDVLLKLPSIYELARKNSYVRSTDKEPGYVRHADRRYRNKPKP